MNKAIYLLLLFFFILKRAPVIESVIEKHNVYLDDDFKSFTYFFASSPSASFLSRIIHTHDSRFVQLKLRAGIMNKTYDKAFAINQVSNEIMKGFMTILLFALLPLFLYIGVYGHTQKRLPLTLSAIWAYFSMLIAFFLTNGLLNIGFVTALPIVTGVWVFYLAYSDSTLKTLYVYTRYIFCFIMAKLIYDILTIVHNNTQNDLYYGPTGFLYITLLKGNNYFILKLVHIFVLSFITLVIAKLCPRFFSPNALQSPQSLKADKCIVSFLCSLPIAASLTQIFLLINNSLNPIDPSLFFMIPSSINFLSMNTILPLTIWIITTYVLITLSKLVEKDFNHFLNKIPNKVSHLCQLYF